MFKKLLLITLFFFLGFTILFGAEKKIGAGVILGSPAGLSFKYFLNKSNAIDGALAWSLKANENFRFHTDYLWHNYNFFKKNLDLPLTLYYGFGIKGIIDKDFIFSLRGSIGMLYFFKDVPIDIFFEIAPSLDIIPATDFSMDAAMGARFFFNVK